MLDGASPDLITAVSNGDFAAVKKFILYGADVNTKNSEGSSALILAVNQRHTEVAQALVDAGAHVNVSDWLDRIPLFSAAQYNFIDILRLLIEADADVNMVNSRGDTVLRVAAAFGHAKIVEILLATPGIIIDATEINGWSAVDYAAVNGHIDIVGLLLVAGAKIPVSNFQMLNAHYMQIVGNEIVVRDHRTGFQLANSAGLSEVCLTRLNPNYERKIGGLLQQWHNRFKQHPNDPEKFRIYCSLSCIAIEHNNFSLLDDLLQNAKIASYYSSPANLTKPELAIHQYVLEKLLKEINGICIATDYAVPPYVMMEIAKWLPFCSREKPVFLLRMFEHRIRTVNNIHQQREEREQTAEVAAPAMRILHA